MSRCRLPRRPWPWACADASSWRRCLVWQLRQQARERRTPGEGPGGYRQSVGAEREQPRRPRRWACPRTSVLAILGLRRSLRRRQEGEADAAAAVHEAGRWAADRLAFVAVGFADVAPWALQERASLSCRSRSRNHRLRHRHRCRHRSHRRSRRHHHRNRRHRRPKRLDRCPTLSDHGRHASRDDVCELVAPWALGPFRRQLRLLKHLLRLNRALLRPFQLISVPVRRDSRPVCRPWTYSLRVRSPSR